MHYTTKFVWSSSKTRMYVFYNYRQIGYIPTEVDFVYKNRHYTTVHIMQVLASNSKKSIPNIPRMTVYDWYGHDLDRPRLNKQLFVKLSDFSSKSIPQHPKPINSKR